MRNGVQGSQFANGNFDDWVALIEKAYAEARTRRPNAPRVGMERQQRVGFGRLDGIAAGARRTLRRSRPDNDGDRLRACSAISATWRNSLNFDHARRTGLELECGRDEVADVDARDSTRSGNLVGGTSSMYE